MRRNILKWAAALAASAAFVVPAAAQEWPSRPVKIIVGYVPGGGPDFVARSFGQKLSELLGQPFVVENRPGAGATTATSFVAKSAPDGYTLLLGETGQLVVAPHVYRKLPYDTLKDFTPISLMASGPLIVVSNGQRPIKTLADLVREAKANPGKIDVGTSGIGTIHHIALEVLKADAGLDLNHVPYKGSGQSMSGVLAGDVPLLITSMTAAAPHVQAGKVTLIAVTSSERLPSIPDAPSVSELVKNFDYSSEMGLLAPAGLPPAILAKLNRAVKQAAESPDLVDLFKKTSTIVRYTTPDEYAQNLRRNMIKYERAVRIARIPTAE